MATGGIFQLITNDGKQDRMLMATALLNKRLLQIEKLRSQNPNIKDPTPTLVDIERTHILFMNAHFKPFCAIGYEYNKVSVQSGTARLGASGVQFSIPQFGDFFNDMVLHLTLGSVTATNAAFWNNTVTNTPTPVVAYGSELLTYVNFVGQAILQKVSFTVNGNPLDDYDSEVMNFHQKFFVTPNKEVGWKRNVGQEVAWPGYANAGAFTNGTTTRYGRGAGVRQGVDIFNGPQTPQVTQPSFDMWIPLLFWFNLDPRLSIPSVSIPYGQRFINVDFANANQILQHQHAYDPELDNPGVNPVPVPDITTCELWINNIFVNPEIHDIFIKRIGFSLIRVHRRQIFTVTTPSNNLLANGLKWPIETIYMGAKPSQNSNLSSSLLLTSWNMYSYVTTNEVGLNSLANNYSWKTTLVAPLTAAVYDTAFNPGNSRTPPGGATPFTSMFGGATVLTVAQVNATLTVNGYPPISGTFANSSVPTPAEIIAATPSVFAPATFNDYTTPLSTLQIQAHGVSLYTTISVNFFNSYVPYTYGGHHINTPFDVGALMITFNLYPGSYQPSGHVNISRAREFYFNYVSSMIGTTALPQADISLVAIAINFLLISDGSAVLRYST